MGQTKAKTTVKLRAKGAGVSHSRMDIAVRDVMSTIDEPTERGGTNLGLTPTDTAIAALAGCTNVIGNKCAAALEIDVGRINVDILCDFDRRGVKADDRNGAATNTMVYCKNRTYSLHTNSRPAPYVCFCRAKHESSTAYVQMQRRNP